MRPIAAYMIMGSLGSITTSVAMPPAVPGCSTIGVKVMPPSLERKSPKSLATHNVLPAIAIFQILAPSSFGRRNTEAQPLGAGGAHAGICVQVTPPSVDLSRPQPER